MHLAEISAKTDPRLLTSLVDGRVIFTLAVLDRGLAFIFFNTEEALWLP